ncbi:MAG: hypothetical protein P4M11_02310 [Candidatus Pacebacteria bacterium]|nr:hypothetical protein [Candidatus Paceibacterota bacterium]
MNNEDISEAGEQRSIPENINALSSVKRSTRPYRKIEDERRLQLLQMLNDRVCNLRQASKALGINYSSAKTIMRTYKEKGRIHKKLTRDRKRRLSLKVPTQSTPGSSEAMRPATSITTRSTPSGSVDQAGEAQGPRFDFAPYPQMIEASFAIRYEAKLENFEKAAATLTLPIPHSFSICRTMTKLKDKAIRNRLPSNPRVCT